MNTGKPCGTSPRIGPRINPAFLVFMAKDYAKKTNNTARKPKRRAANSRSSAKATRPAIPAWLWLATGMAAGAFIMFLMHLKGLAPSPQSQSEPAVVEKPANSATKTSKSDENTVPDTRLQFYEMLKDSTVEVPEPDPATLAEQKGPEKEWILQAGSFKKEADAQRLRAQLILLNLSAAVEETQLKDGQIWHRVVAGPYYNRSQMSKARSILASNDINPLLIERDKR